MNQPLVSVCIPAYNNADYIGETIECILKQTYRNLELIIVDDNSKDQATYQFHFFIKQFFIFQFYIQLPILFL